MCTDVSVTRCVLDGPVVSLPRIRLVLKMNAVAMIFRDKSKIDQVNVVLFCSTVAEQQVLSFDVIMNVPLGVNVLKNVEYFERQVVADLAAEQLFAGLENFLEIISKPVHHKESIFFVFDHGAATASVTGHT